MSESTTIRPKKFSYDKSLLNFASIKFYEIIYKICNDYAEGGTEKDLNKKPMMNCFSIKMCLLINVRDFRFYKRIS